MCIMPSSTCIFLKEGYFSVVKNLVQRLWSSTALPQSLDFWLKQFKVNFQFDTPTVKVLDKAIIGDAVKLVLKPSKKCHAFLAGQHIRLKVFIDGIGHERCYSIANLPSSKGFIELYIKVQGLVSNAIRHQVSIGDVLDVSQPFGDNHSKRFDGFVAGGIGITALWPLFLSAKKDNPDLVLLYLTRLESNESGLPKDNKEYVLFNEIRQSRAFTEGKVKILDGRTTLTNANELLTHFGDTSRLLSCGSEAFNQQVNEVVKKSDKQIDVEFESFKTAEPANISKEYAEHQLILTKSNQTLTVTNQSTLLESLLDAGLKPQYGCKQGICHQCTCRVAPSSLLNDNNKSIQLCTTVPNQSLEIEL